MANINTPSLSELLAAYKTPALDVQQPIQNFVAMKTLKQQEEENKLKNMLAAAKQKLEEQNALDEQRKLQASLTTPEELAAKKFEGEATPEKAKLFVDKEEPPKIIGDWFRSGARSAEGYPIAQNRYDGKEYEMRPEGIRPYDPTKVGLPMPSVPPQLAGSEIDIANSTRDILAKTKDIEASLKPEFTGPIQGRAGKAGQAFDIGATPEKAKFYQDVNFVKDRMIKLITGAQMSEPEAKRIMQELPDETKSDVDFKAKLQNLRAAVKQSFMDRSKRLESQGLRNSYVPTDEELSALTNRPTAAGGDIAAAAKAELERRRAGKR